MAQIAHPWAVLLTLVALLLSACQSTPSSDGKLPQPPANAPAEWYLAAAEEAVDSGDLATARDAYLAAAELQSASAAYALGGFYETGTTVTADRNAARRWYQQAADLGHPGAATAVARLLLQDRDVSAALKVLEPLAAASGDTVVV